jgi:hypothetical protein
MQVSSTRSFSLSLLASLKTARREADHRFAANQKRANK